MRAKDIEREIGIGDGKNRTSAGDLMYRDAKDDARFCKTEGRTGSFALKPDGDAVTTSNQRPSATVHGDRVALADESKDGKYHVVGPSGRGYAFVAALCGQPLDLDTVTAAGGVHVSRRCGANGCGQRWAKLEVR
jgi:hypothetical protein